MGERVLFVLLLLQFYREDRWRGSQEALSFRARCREPQVVLRVHIKRGRQVLRILIVAMASNDLRALVSASPVSQILRVKQHGMLQVVSTRRRKEDPYLKLNAR